MKKKQQVKEDDSVKTRIIKARKAIRKKQQALKLGRAEGQILRSRYFEPVTEPLKKLIEVTKVKEEVLPETVSSIIKEELPKAMSTFIKESASPRESPRQQQQTTATAVPIRVEPQSPQQIAEYDPFTEEEHQEIEAEKTMDEFRREYQSMIDQYPDRVDEYLEQYNILPRVYIDGLLSDTKGEYDTSTGVRYEETTNKFFLGNSALEIDGNDIVVGDIRYKGTPGLYELIFKTKPTGFTKEDETRYQDILQRTSVHKRNFDPKGQVKGSKAIKYTTIIKPLTFRYRSASARDPTGGSGLIGSTMIASDAPYQYVYWDNVNELVDRLRLLLASEIAGHTNHNNEIASLIEELKEAGVVE